MKQGYRLIIVDKAGVLVAEFQLTENALAQPEAFVAALKQSVEDIEEEEPGRGDVGPRGWVCAPPTQVRGAPVGTSAHVTRCSMRNSSS